MSEYEFKCACKLECRPDWGYKYIQMNDNEHEYYFNCESEWGSECMTVNVSTSMSIITSLCLSSTSRNW